MTPLFTKLPSRTSNFSIALDYPSQNFLRFLNPTLYTQKGNVWFDFLLILALLTYLLNPSLLANHGKVSRLAFVSLASFVVPKMANFQ